LLHTLNLIFQTIGVFLLGTLVFDLVHVLFHIALTSKKRGIRRLGRWHLVHHRFFTPQLQINSKWTLRNLSQHVTLEYSTQMLTSFCCLFFLNVTPVYLAMILQTFIFLCVIKDRGQDLHHRPMSKFKRYGGGFWVDAAYHAQHHMCPNRFFSSYVKLIDYLLGSALNLSAKKIVMTGANGALGSQLKRLLEKEGARITPFKFGVDYDYQSYNNFIPYLRQANILLLCHGTKYNDTENANCISFVKLIELYKSSYQGDQVPEVWAVGSEIECHPCFGIKKLYPYADSKRKYARYARYFYHAKDLHYRHLVHSAFSSKMGPGLMSARFAAWMTLFLLKRGFKYIPVTYTGFALLNFIRFKFAPRHLMTLE